MFIDLQDLQLVLERSSKMEVDNELFVEICIRKKQIKEIPERFFPVVNEFKQYESEDRLVLDVPKHWVGLKDGTLIAMLKEFNEAMYVALAYVSTDKEENVTDFEGLPVDMYDTVFHGKRVAKYVKKRLRIVKVLDNERNTFEIRGYELDLKFVEPVISVLYIYSGSPTSGVKLEDFLK